MHHIKLNYAQINLRDTMWPKMTGRKLLSAFMTSDIQSTQNRITLGHNNDVIMSAMVSQITSLMIVYSGVYSGADQRKHQSSTSLACVWGIHRWTVNSPHKGPVTRKMFLFDHHAFRFELHTQNIINQSNATRTFIHSAIHQITFRLGLFQ